jgi:hypothetical protein
VTDSAGEIENSGDASVIGEGSGAGDS